MPNREALTILVQKKDNPTDQIFVFWPSDPKIGVKPIQRCAPAERHCSDHAPPRRGPPRAVMTRPAPCVRTAGTSTRCDRTR